MDAASRIDKKHFLGVFSDLRGFPKSASACACLRVPNGPESPINFRNPTKEGGAEVHRSKGTWEDGHVQYPLCCECIGGETNPAGFAVSGPIP